MAGKIFDSREKVARECRRVEFSGEFAGVLGAGAVRYALGSDGLCGLVSKGLGEDVRSGALFVFTNKRRSRLKVLYFDGTGLWLMPQRLEQGTFA